MSIILLTQQLQFSFKSCYFRIRSVSPFFYFKNDQGCVLKEKAKKANVSAAYPLIIFKINERRN